MPATSGPKIQPWKILSMEEAENIPYSKPNDTEGGSSGGGSSGGGSSGGGSSGGGSLPDPSMGAMTRPMKFR